ncbi:polysaccharide pyruvyl transferase family protein [Prosthecobacter sp.]|uniref:polysaccharide pyruvyl transferase family protein n=1 Tax=Prosthecobacter sp. TaxID=1965333 RepID=UPI00248955F0|nr:polysaccharide pyruvyl transferase family protein [Prosthecobacter sp.]MDI1313484.1 polysaccharide pyruvyl transferase family protein [Prosthecobacter sp.]
MKIAFVGASGYGNVGDDTYPLVFAQELPAHELVIYNSDLPAALPEDLDMLVMGGGGIVYNHGKAGAEEIESPHFRCMKFYMDAAIQRGIPWGFLSCGFQFQNNCEADDAATLQPWAYYLKQAHFITLRSPRCVLIAQELSGREDVVFAPDAAYLYQPEIATPLEDVRSITLVPAGLVNARNMLMNHYLRQFAASGVAVTWLGMGAAVDDHALLSEAAERFPQAQIVAGAGPQVAFETIARSRLVITGRYHGMIFARVSRVPFITPVDVPYKIRMENLDETTGAATTHFEVLRRFMPR